MRKTVETTWRVLACLAGVLVFTGGVAAQSRSLTFPYLADGAGVRFELTLTNPTGGVERGRIEFRSDQGELVDFAFDGFSANGPIAFELAGGAALKLESRGVGPLVVGHAVVVSDNASSLLQGSLVLTIGTNEVSIPPSHGHTRAHLFVEDNAEATTGIAFANTGEKQARVALRLLTASGIPVSQLEIEIPPRTSRAEMFSEIFTDMEGDFAGTIHAMSDQQFHMVGLRQQRSTLSISGLPNAPFAFPGAGSQLIFLADSGVRIDASSYSEEQLGKSVFNLTGVKQSQRPQTIRIRNIHPNRAVTVHFRFTNESCEEVLGFLIVLECGQEIAFDPFQWTLPGTGLAGPPIRTDQVLFGSQAPLDVEPISARQFGTGRFLVSATAVGARLNGGDLAELLYPNELSTPGKCGMTTVNTGVVAGVSKENLSHCNAIPMSFDYLSGSLEISPQCLGRQISANAQTRKPTSFLRTLTRVDEHCVQQTLPALCLSSQIMESLRSEADCPESAGVLTVTFDDETFSLMP